MMYVIGIPYTVGSMKAQYIYVASYSLAWPGAYT